MSKRQRNANHINRRKDYLKLFPDDKASESERMRSRALKEAQEVRRFEIQLYWHRTAFFWAFITIIYTALFSVLCKYVDSSCSKYSFFVPAISALSGLGYFFSVAWHMVNKGSKFWQKNWETHVSLLEEAEIGPLYDVYLNPKGTLKERFCPTSAFDFSVTRINMWASTIMVLASLMCAIGINIWLVREQEASLCMVLIPSFLILILCSFMFFCSDGNKDIKIQDKISGELNMIHVVPKRKYRRET